jgi:ATP-binding cassette subfamily B (MDR/TAP) protein 1
MFVITGAMVPLMKASALADIKAVSATAARLFSLFDRRCAIDAFSDEGLKPQECRGEVEVKDVVFAYPTSPDHMVCKNFSLRIPAGQTMALCGASGSGKSTLIQLLERFYDPSSGVITLDGVDIKTLNVRWLRGQLGLVGQEPVLFQGTVAQNIAYGKDGVASQEEIEEAAKAANAHAFITENLQDGYNTEVGQSGGKLSGGQKQRVAIARALIKKPAVLLLDEATSALDNQSEAVVQNALDQVMEKQKLTTIVIAHRLSTIRNAHCIAVINEGSVVEQGTHQELLNQQGLYASLVLSNS